MPEINWVLDYKNCRKFKQWTPQHRTWESCCGDCFVLSSPKHAINLTSEWNIIKIVFAHKTTITFSVRRGFQLPSSPLFMFNLLQASTPRHIKCAQEFWLILDHKWPSAHKHTLRQSWNIARKHQAITAIAKSSGNFYKFFSFFMLAGTKVINKF